MRFFAQILGVISIYFALGCASTAMRLPASFKPKYNSKIVNSLKSAAVNGVLFEVNESVFKDVPVRQVDRCRKVEAPNWNLVFLNVLEVIDKNPEYYEKFHIVNFKRGDRAKAEITKDIDGLSYLNITYVKREIHDKITPETSLPCLESSSEFLGKNLVTTFIDWPPGEEIDLVLRQASIKAKIDRFQFNTEFLVFLADRQTILKLNPEVAFERNYQGGYLLESWLEKMAQELHQKDIDIEYVNYWLKEISTHSKQANSIQFFGLHSESSLSYGVQVDSVGKFSRKLNNYQEPTYLFMSYRQHNGDYIYSDLKDLNQCLRGLMGIYHNPLSMGTTLESDDDSFLSPGYSCKLETKD